MQLEIYVMAIRRELFNKTGNFNERLGDGSNREFLCRAALECEPMFLECSDVEWKHAYGESRFYTNAYLLARYVKQLTDEGRMEAMLNTYMAYARDRGYQAYFEKVLGELLEPDQTMYQKIYLATAPIFIIRGSDICYGVLSTFADQLARALRRRGQRVITTEGSDTDADCIDMLHREYFRAIIGFQAAILLKPVFHDIRGKRFEFWFDHPIFFHSLLDQMDTPVTFLCQDEDHADYINRMCQKGYGIQFPPAVESETGISQKKLYDISFMGSYFAEKQLWAVVNDMGDELGKLAREVANYLLDHPNQNYNEVIEMFLGQYPQVTEQYPYEVILEHLWEACRIAPCTYRNRVIRCILDAGYELHVYGESWDNYPKQEGDRLICHDKIAPKDIPRVVGKSKISLNIMSWHKAGMTERIMEIMMGGSICLTDETRYLRKHFIQFEDIAMFRLDALEQLPALIDRLLGDDALRQKITENAYQKVMDEHTWDTRTEQFLDLLKEMEERAGQD